MSGGISDMLYMRNKCDQNFLFCIHFAIVIYGFYFRISGPGAGEDAEKRQEEQPERQSVHSFHRFRVLIAGKYNLFYSTNGRQIADKTGQITDFSYLCPYILICMAKHIVLGKTGEQIAAEYLLAHGYDIRETNWRCGRLEIDIVATRGTTLVIVEVKTRRTEAFGMPEDAVDNRKIRNLILAADAYIRMTDLPFEIQFDIISILCNSDSYEIEHIENAFYPTIQNSRYGY